MEFIRESKSRPFFCYVPFHLVHAPMQAKDADLKDVDPKVTDETKRTYAAMVQALDKNVGAILGELDKLGLRDNTIVVFTSDNGATRDGSNLPFRGGKHSVFEGGTHLPTVIHWPKGKVTSRTWDGLCGALDMFPTLLAMADLKMPGTRPLDGKSFWPALRDNTASPVESYYWAWHNEDAIRTADWRMHRFFDRAELYDIRADIGETKNVADAHPEVVKSLTTKMNAWAESLSAALTHQPAPAKLNAKPAPEGEVIEVTVTVTAAAKPKDQLIVPIASFAGQQYATDYVEYDIAIAPDSLHRGFYYSPLKGNDSKAITINFKRGEGIDQFGREQAAGPEVLGGPACGSTASSACAAPRPARCRAMASSSKAADPAPTKSISTTSAFAMPTAAPRRSGRMTKTLDSKKLLIVRHSQALRFVPCRLPKFTNSHPYDPAKVSWSHHRGFAGLAGGNSRCRDD